MKKIFFSNICRAYGGDHGGSAYLQAFAKFLTEHYMKRPLDRIYLMVKQAMITAQQVNTPSSHWWLDFTLHKLDLADQQKKVKQFFSLT